MYVATIWLMFNLKYNSNEENVGCLLVVIYLMTLVSDYIVSNVRINESLMEDITSGPFQVLYRYLYLGLPSY
jgi:hypothetical protein